MTINEVKIEHIERLKDIQLTELMKHLIQTELTNNEIGGDVFVPLNITTGDAGDDGKVTWENQKEKTKWLKNRYCLFQNKATELGPTACYEELLRTEFAGKQRELKAEIEKLVRANGCFVLFTNKNLNTTLKEGRINKFREAIRDAGFDNHNTIEIKIYDNNSIKDWVNENMSSIILVQKMNDIHRIPFLNWEEWKATLESSDVIYVSDETIDKSIKNLIFQIKENKTARLIGHSGLGKTRLALEALSKEIGLQKQCLYYELGVHGNLIDLMGFLMSNQNKEGILIIDSCSEDDHNTITSTIKSLTSFSVLTIDISSRATDPNTILIDRNSQRDIVKQIITNMIGTTHSKSDIDYLSNVCEGYPWMAVRFCKQIISQGIKDFHGQIPSTFIKKLLFGGSSDGDEKEYDVIRSCSVFSTFGFLDDDLRGFLEEFEKDNLEEQSEFIRTQVYDGVISKTEFYSICKKYLHQDIIEKRGKYFMVKPTVLAISLATEWLLETPPSRIIDIIEKLQGKPLSYAFVERLKDLDQIDKAKQIAHELFGPESPFGSAEVLNTSWGSQLFRYIVEVNPESMATTIYNSFGQMSNEDLLNVKVGRRSLVWALEKLCFRKESFDKAIKVLFKFALAENENIGNNATGQLLHLFHIHLAGTETSLANRFETVKMFLENTDETSKSLALKCISSALSNYRFSRMMGAEQQGSGAPLKDYVPSNDEIKKYWTNSFNLLVSEHNSTHTLKSEIEETLIASISSMLTISEIQPVLNAIEKVTDNYSLLWLPCIDTLKWSLEYQKELSEEDRKIIDEIIVKLQPKSLKDRLYTIVTKPSWETYEKDEKGELINKPQLNAIKYAEQLIKDNIDITSHLIELSNGEQRQSFHFGHTFGNKIKNKYEFGSKILESFLAVKNTERNINLFSGFLSGIENEETIRKLYEKFLEDTDEPSYAFHLIKLINPELEDFLNLIKICKDNSLHISNFLSFSYGYSFKNLDDEEIKTLLNEISNYNSLGKWTCISLIYTMTFRDNSEWSTYRDIAISTIQSENLLLSKTVVQVEGTHWKQIVLRVLDEKPQDDFICYVASNIIEFCEKESFVYRADTLLSPILEKLFTNHFALMWPIISRAFIGDYRLFWNIRSLFESGFLKSSGFIFNIPENEELIKNWIRNNPDLAPQRIANIMPVRSIDSEQSKWHPISKMIIDEYGNNKKVLSEIGSNMGTFGGSGSLVPYYEDQLKMLTILKIHKIPEVSSWVGKMITYTEKQIKREKLKDEEWG